MEKLHPAVAELARQLVVKANDAGIQVMIIKTVVTDEEQDSLYNRGLTRARGGTSMHNLGLAFDIVPVIDGKPSLEDAEAFRKLGELGKSLGLTWGGDWTVKDLPHFELRPTMSAQ